MPKITSNGRNFCAKFLCVAALTLSVGVTSLWAQSNTVYTDPVGFITLTAVGTNGLSGNVLSFWGLGMTQIVTNRGLVGTVTTPKQIPVNNTLTPGEFSAVSNIPAFFIEITSGTGAGVFDDIISNDANNVYTYTDISSEAPAGVTYKIYPHWTLASVFGPADQSGLQGNSLASGADLVIVQNPVNQTYVSYFYNTSSKTGGPGWRGVGANSLTDFSAQPLYVDQGILIEKQTGTNLNVLLVGAVKLGQTVQPVYGTNTFVGNVYASSAVTLTNSGLYTGNPATGLVGASTASSADLVLIHNDATQVYNAYFWNTSTKTGGTGWRLLGANSLTDQGNTPIPLGANVFLQLQPGHPGFNYNAQAPY